MITLHLRTFAYSPWLFHLFFLIIIHYLLFLFPLPCPLSSRRDSFKRLSFRRTQEENSWVLQTGWGGCHTSERKREDKMKEERGGQEKEQQEQYAVSTMEDSRFLSDLAMCINVGCVFTFMMSGCLSEEGKASEHIQKWMVGWESPAKCSLLSISL